LHELEEYMIKCERAEFLEEKGINTEVYCHCSDDADFKCTAYETIYAIVELMKLSTTKF